MSQTTKQTEAAINPFAEAKNCVAIKPKSVAVSAFVYKSLADLKNLILFVGNRPLINPDTSLQFKKMTVKENSVILRNAYGEVTTVMSFEDAANRFDIAAQHDFSQADANKVEEKPVKTITKN